VFLGYSFVRLNSTGTSSIARMLTVQRQFVYNFSKGLALRRCRGSNIMAQSGRTNVDTTVAHFVVGRATSSNQHSKFQPYAQALFGGAYATSSAQIVRNARG